MNLLTTEWKAGKEIGILILRLAAGYFILYGHGFNKLEVIFTGQEIKFLDPIGLGTNLSFYLVAFAEGICALLIILGLYTRLAALVLAFNFIVILIVHSADNFIDIEHIYLYLLNLHSEAPLAYIFHN